VSLLMEALRKAENAKRQSGEPRDAAPAVDALSQRSELKLEPLTPLVAQPLPVLTQHLDLLNADLAATCAASLSEPAPTASGSQHSSATVTSAPNIHAARQEERERNAAHTVFAVKQAQQVRNVRWIFFGLLATALLGIGGYFWWQMQSLNQGTFVRPAEAALTALTPRLETPETLTTPTDPPATIAARAALPALISDLVPPSATQTQTPAEAERAAPSPSPQRLPDIPIRLSTHQPKANPTLEHAYQALQDDRLNDAQRNYEQVLRGEPQNVDALLGLATLAVRQGLVGEASHLYLRALEADPKDLTALTGLINLQEQADPVLSESRLKTLLATQPDASTLNFALGNLLAGQQRWNDAQQAYFRAYTAEPHNADYLYNLAVSLDHLHQNKLAAQYYQNALDAAGMRSSAFDKGQVQRRLLDLQP
jgi:Tfp pilus assembly protein PilF